MRRRRRRSLVADTIRTIVIRIVSATRLLLLFLLRCMVKYCKLFVQNFS